MAAMRRLPRTAITPWSERLAFTHLMDTRLPDLSKGTAQKVGLAQALLASPELLVLDEPFAGLDTTTRADLRTLLTELTTQGTTIIASDHQSCLTQLPNLRQVHIANTAVTQAQSHPPALDDTSHPNQLPQDEWTVVEVLVRPAEREAVTAKLRADGYNLRTPTN
jgi:ABC-type multidrug transport system ATPase subunit